MLFEKKVRCKVDNDRPPLSYVLPMYYLTHTTPAIFTLANFPLSSQLDKTKGILNHAK